MKKVVFITGATGNVGGKLVPLILNTMPEAGLKLLVRGKSQTEAIDRVVQTITRLDPDFDPGELKTRCEILVGDISESNLGLAATDYNRIAGDVSHVIHSAAATKFRMPPELSRAVNLNGTRHVTGFALRAKELGGLDGFAHISTAYVCGDRGGKIKELPVNDAAVLSNIYEQTKWEAERYLQTFSKDFNLKIFRPSIIAGDSIMGRINDFNVLYLPLRLILSGKIRYLPCRADTPLDIIPLDYAAEAIRHIFFSGKQNENLIYNIVSGSGREATVEEVVHAAISYCRRIRPELTIPGVKYISALAVGSRVLKNFKYLERSQRLMQAYMPYLSRKRHFLNDNTIRALEGSSLTVPPLGAYFENLMEYFYKSELHKRLPRAA
jgi:long-chain acyl-CoA synthetase